jgi:predicted N-formylglutamate amidohydrolase
MRFRTNDFMSAPWRQPLLGGSDPPPAVVIRKDGRADILLLGDHAGNAIPSSLEGFGVSTSDLARHIAWDLGVRGLGEALAAELDATFIRQSFSRLVIDCNRDPRTAGSIVESSDGTPVSGNVGLGPDAREQRRVAIHEPYHQTIAEELERRRARGAPPVIVALHSFTPALAGAQRPWHIGLLHDAGDTTLSRALLARLRQERELCVGDNEPYRMNGTDYTIPRHAYPAGARYLEVEFRQDLLPDVEHERLWASRFAEWLDDAIARP